MGNHDDRARSGESVRRAAPADPRGPGVRRQRAAHHRAGLHRPGPHHGEVSSEQLTGWPTELAAPAPHGTILAMHHPPVPSVLDLAVLRRAARPGGLAEVLEGTDVRSILAGHLHYSSIATFAGIPVSVASATCYTQDLNVRAAAPAAATARRRSTWCTSTRTRCCTPSCRSAVSDRTRTARETPAGSSAGRRHRGPAARAARPVTRARPGDEPMTARLSRFGSAEPVPSPRSAGLLPRRRDREVALQEVGDTRRCAPRPDLGVAAVVEAEEVHGRASSAARPAVASPTHGGVDVADLGIRPAAPPGRSAARSSGRASWSPRCRSPSGTGWPRCARTRRGTRAPSRSSTLLRSGAARVLQVPGGDPAEALAEQAAVHAGGVLETAARRVVVARGRCGCRASMNLVTPPGEKNSRAHRTAEEHVVVGVEEVLGEALDVVQLALDGVRVERRQHRGVGEELLAAARCVTRVLGQPRRARRVGGDEDAADPGREHVDRAQRVLAARRSGGSGPRRRRPRPPRTFCMRWARARWNSRSVPSTQEKTMSMSKLDVAGVVGRTCSRGSARCGRSVRRSPRTASAARQRAPGQRVFDRADDSSSSPKRHNSSCTAVPRAVRSPPMGSIRGRYSRKIARLVAVGEARRRPPARAVCLLRVHGLRVERLVRAGADQGRAQLRRAVPSHRDHRPVVVAAHQEEVDTCAWSSTARTNSRSSTIACCGVREVLTSA